MTDEREAADTSPDEPETDSAGLPDEVRDGDVGETEPSGTPLDPDDSPDD